MSLSFCKGVTVLEQINSFVAQAVGIIWGLPMVIALVGTGVLLTILFRGIQFRAFKHAIDVIRGRYDDPNDPGEISHFAALCTALSATVGLGNIAGVAVAVHNGGPGATFWMIVTGLLGMTTKFTEVTAALMYRRIDEKGVVHGGGMYAIERGLGPKWKPMAVFFAICCIFGSLGGANLFQANQVAAVLRTNFNIEPLYTGLVLSILTAVVIIGGIKRIAHVTSALVPLMAIIYFIGCMLVIGMHLPEAPAMLLRIVTEAFTGTAASGAFAGIVVREAIVNGVRRACFSNEAGLGTSPIAHSAATTKEPTREGVVALLEPFIDTVIICTMTALVILLTGTWMENTTGVDLTVHAFDSVLPGFGRWFVPVAVFLFAYSTLISWSYYGERAADYLAGDKGVHIFKVIFSLAATFGAIWSLDTVLNFADMMFGLMLIPNLLALWLLYPKIKAEVDQYFSKLKNGAFKTKW